MGPWLLINAFLANTDQVRNTASNNAHARGIAQVRRRQENEEFRKLSELLPVARAISSKHLDKGTIIRLAGAYCRLNRVIAHWKSQKCLSNGPLVENNVINVSL
jgi:hypothetical protein